MSRSTALAPRSEKGLLTPDNCVVALVDLQPQMLFGTANFDRQSIINSNVALSKAARVFNVPTVLTTVESKSFSGYIWPQIQAVFPDQTPDRALDDELLGRRELRQRGPEERSQEARAGGAVDRNVCRAADDSGDS